MISQTENVGICPVLFIVFPAMKCTFGSFISINIYCCSVCLVAFVHDDPTEYTAYYLECILFYKSCR